MTSFFKSKRRTHYQVIDGDDTEAGPLIDEGGSSPPTHSVPDVAYQGTTDRRRQSSLSISRGPGQWDHIENLDEFFQLVYKYHQGSGYLCILLRNCFTLFQLIFVVAFSTFLMECVDYNVLFNNTPLDSQGRNITGKRHISDAVIYQCASHFSPMVVFTLLLAVVFWMFYLLRFGYQMLKYKDIQEFYNNVLEIPDSQLGNVTWRDIVQQICKVQPKIHLSVNQETLTEYDIYGRILRHKNYFIGMVYDEIIPPFLDLPFLGKVPYFPSLLIKNIEWILFRGTWDCSPWKSHYQLKDEYKQIGSMELATAKLQKAIAFAAVLNLIFLPFIFIYQILFAFFSNADLAKREPGAFGMRKYSNYGREKLRHFNELDHELRLRLNRSYEFSVRYMEQFISPVLEIIAKYLTFAAASIFTVLGLLTIWDEDVLTFEHVITIMSACAGVIFVCRSFIANENLVFCPDFLMKQIVANIHYAPESWLREAHSSEVVNEFGKLFHMRAYAIALDVFSPIFNPFILYFVICPKAGEIVQFFMEKNRYVPELGDVCSYALMDLKDGEKELSELKNNDNNDSPPSTHRVFSHVINKNKSRGKIELSLLNFATQNPDWKPSPEAAKFIQQVHERTKDTNVGQNLLHSLKDIERPIANSLNSKSMIASNIAAANREQRNVDKSMVASNISDGTNDERMRPLSPLFDSLAMSVIQQHVGMEYAQPTHLQQTNRQALEMSMNALLVNQILMSSHHQREPETYGSFANPQQNEPSPLNPLGPLNDAENNQQESEAEEALDELPPMHFQATQNQEESDIWGVPSQSQYHSHYDPL
jgi:autophagy-related protein 9|uniref:Autophagy-related protein 9 n=1 Tax=Panagrolaimus sp. PS1159 TaxID=55785 RepID=A0AC35GGN3_9BILA